MTSDRHIIALRVYVTACNPGDLPTKRDVENKIVSLLLSMPRLEDGASWCVHATSMVELPPEDPCMHSAQSWSVDRDGTTYCDDCESNLVRGEDGYWYKRRS